MIFIVIRYLYDFTGNLIKMLFQVSSFRGLSSVVGYNVKAYQYVANTIRSLSCCNSAAGL